jgi:hypothetical protein
MFTFIYIYIYIYIYIPFNVSNLFKILFAMISLLFNFIFGHIYIKSCDKSKYLLSTNFVNNIKQARSYETYKEVLQKT